jgi:hypothetical protein
VRESARNGDYGRSGNPQGRKPLIENIHELAREHAAEAIAGLVESMRQRKDPISP